jgi:hypothetical protein
MADLEFVADFTDLQLMRRELVGVSKDAQKSAGVFEREYRKVERQLARVAKENQKAFNAILGVDRATKSAKQSASVFAQALREQDKAAKEASRSVGQHANTVQRYTKSVQRSTRGIGQFSTFTQQAGYQVGDFLVQIQSGTNPMVAFGQQATQVAGTLTLFGGAMVGVGTALGVAIPLLTAYGAYLMRTKAPTEDAEKVTTELANALKTLEQVDLSNASSQVAQFANSAIQKYSLLLESIERVAEEERSRGFSNIIDTFAPADEIEKRRKSIEGMIKLANDAGQETNANIEYQKAVLQDEVRTREILLSIAGKTRQETAENLNAAIGRLSQENLLTTELEQQLIAFADQAGLTSVILTDMEKTTKEIEEQKTKTGDLSMLSETLSDIFETMSMDNILSQMDSLNSKLGSAIFGAGTLGGRLRGLFDAGVAAAERAAYAQQIGGGRSMGRGGPTAEEIQNYDPRAQIAYTPGGTAGVPLPSTPSTPSGGGSSISPIQQAEEYLQKLEREAEFKRSLVGLSDEQSAIETRREQLINQLNGYEEGLSDAYTQRIEEIIKTESETRKLMEAEQQRQQLMNTIEGHIENAFMSMVDGSKSVEDAFKSMLRNIILAIYQEKVAKAGANAIMNLLGLANGGAFERGGKFTAYANGGVVGSPTMFSHSGGLGVMGEAGPEAIMPLKRGKNGKLGVQMEGSSQPVVVNNNFNISANGDDSVKRIVRGEIPRITEATKAAVVDAKRRGGTYGRSF